MAEKVLIVKYGEIAMRGNNKYIFINRLISAIRKNLDPYGNYYVVRDPGRLIVENRCLLYTSFCYIFVILPSLDSILFFLRKRCV